MEKVILYRSVLEFFKIEREIITLESKVGKVSELKSGISELESRKDIVKRDFDIALGFSDKEEIKRLGEIILGYSRKQMSLLEELKFIRRTLKNMIDLVLDQMNIVESLKDVEINLDEVRELYDGYLDKLEGERYEELVGYEVIDLNVSCL